MQESCLCFCSFASYTKDNPRHGCFVMCTALALAEDTSSLVRPELGRPITKNDDEKPYLPVAFTQPGFVKGSS